MAESEKARAAHPIGKGQVALGHSVESIKGRARSKTRPAWLHRCRVRRQASIEASVAVVATVPAARHIGGSVPITAIHHAMDGTSRVIDVLNDLWTVKRALIDQNVARSKVCAARDLEVHADRFSNIAFGHMREVADLLDRVVALGGLPRLDTVPAVAVGDELAQQMQLSLDAERATTPRYETTLRICDEAGDHETRTLVETALDNQRRHVSWLEDELRASASNAPG